MYSEISIEQRAHDLAVQATVLYYQQKNIFLDTDDATCSFEFGTTYRCFLADIRKSITKDIENLRQ